MYCDIITYRASITFSTYKEIISIVRNTMCHVNKPMFNAQKHTFKSKLEIYYNLYFH